MLVQIYTAQSVAEALALADAGVGHIGLTPAQGGLPGERPLSELRAIADALRGPLHGMPAALPVPAGGMTVARVPELVRCYGRDAMLLIGGSLLASDDVAARTRAFADAVA